MSRYGNYDMENLYDNIADCGLEPNDVIRIFGDALQALVRKYNNNNNRHNLRDTSCKV